MTRQDCHLCTDAWKLLQTYQKQHDFVLETVDVDSDPDLVAKYGNCVPVVLVNGQVRFRGRVNEVLLRRLIEGRTLMYAFATRERSVQPTDARAIRFKQDFTFRFAPIFAIPCR